MSDSSQPKDSLPTFSIEPLNVEDILKDCMIHASGTGASADVITISSDPNLTAYSGNTLSIDLNLQNYAAGPVISTGTLSTDTITLSGLDSSHFTFNLPKEWQDAFPSWDKVQDMCEKYPGLKVAFENFRMFYEMVKDDYDNPTPKK